MHEIIFKGGTSDFSVEDRSGEVNHEQTISTRGQFALEKNRLPAGVHHTRSVMRS